MGVVATAGDGDRRRVEPFEQAQDDIHAGVAVGLAGARNGDGLDLDAGRREEEGDRHEIVGCDIGVDQQGESVGRGIRRRGGGRRGARAAPADHEHAEQDDDEACAQGDHAYRSFRRETRAARDRCTRYGAPSKP